MRHARDIILFGVLTLPVLLRAEIVVTICNADSSPGAGVDLKRAIAAGGLITFNCPAGSVIPFSQLYNVTTPTQIDGGGKVTLDGSGKQMFVVGASVAFSLTGLTIRNAQAPGTIFDAGVITGGAVITIENCRFSDNGFAITSTGSVTVRGSSFQNSQATVIFAKNIDLTNSTLRGAAKFPVIEGGGGTVAIRGSNLIGGTGSSFLPPCTLSITGSSISASTATAILSFCTTTISKSQFSSNHGLHGGALFLTANAPGLQITGSSFTSNSADADGGAISFDSTTDGDRVLTLQDVIFEGNSAPDGGAIYLGSNLENNVQVNGKAIIFSKNSAAGTGGAIAGSNAGLTLSRVLFGGNSAGKSGGAIEMTLFSPRPITVANAVFTGNSSPKGSVFHGNGIHMVNATVANSKTSAAISPFWPTANSNLPPDPWRLISLLNVAFWRNAAGACESGVFSKLFHDAGHNLQFPAAGCEPTITITDPNFDSMFIPAMGGPADGTGDLATCLMAPVSGVDLYGRHRPQGKSCAIGAVEGDIQDVVLQSNPSYGNLPPNPPNCQCGPGANCPTPPKCYPPNPSITPSTTPTSQAQPPSGPTSDCNCTQPAPYTGKKPPPK